MTDVIMHTIGIISILWSVIQILHLWALLDSFEVKYLKAKINIKPQFFIPFVGMIFYSVWIFIG